MGQPGLDPHPSRPDKEQKERIFLENLALLENENDAVLQGISELVKILEEPGNTTVSDKARATMQKIKAKVDHLHEIATTHFKAYPLPFDLVQ